MYTPCDNGPCPFGESHRMYFCRDNCGLGVDNDVPDDPPIDELPSDESSEDFDEREDEKWNEDWPERESDDEPDIGLDQECDDFNPYAGSIVIESEDPIE